MKKLSIVLVVLFSTALISCEEKEKESVPLEGFTIDVSINNINTSEAYLYNHKNIAIDTALVSNNYVNFSGVIDTIQLYTVQFKNNNLKIPILLENTPMYVYASPLSQIAFGSVSQNELNSYNEALALIKNKLKASIDTQNESELDSINSVIFNYSVAKIKSTNHAPIADLIFDKILIDNDLNKNDLLALKAISETNNHKKWLPKINSEIDKYLALELLEEQKKLAEVAKPRVIKRQQAPLFYGESLDGSNLSLQSALNGKKAVLIDFWASWCGPCRTVTPQVRSIYNRYKNKGFDIITISEDKTRAAWTNGITEDNMLAWNHIYDDNMRIAYMFNVESIPHMILLDGNGGIIENKISISRLENELKKIFK